MRRRSIALSLLVVIASVCLVVAMVKAGPLGRHPLVAARLAGMRPAPVLPVPVAGVRIVRVFGPGGEWHYYAHLERFGPIAPGQVVTPGTILGYVGDSGNAKGTPPHLHYGIYRMFGGAMNPYTRLAARRAA